MNQKYSPLSLLTNDIQYQKHNSQFFVFSQYPDENQCHRVSRTAHNLCLLGKKTAHNLCSPTELKNVSVAQNLCFRILQTKTINSAHNLYFVMEFRNRFSGLVQGQKYSSQSAFSNDIPNQKYISQNLHFLMEIRPGNTSLVSDQNRTRNTLRAHNQLYNVLQKQTLTIFIYKQKLEPETQLTISAFQWSKKMNAARKLSLKILVQIRIKNAPHNLQ